MGFVKGTRELFDGGLTQDGSLHSQYCSKPLVDGGSFVSKYVYQKRIAQYTEVVRACVNALAPEAELRAICRCRASRFLLLNHR